MERYALEQDRGRIRTGALRCPGCEQATPIFAGFPLFGDAFPCPGEPTLDALREREQALFGDGQRYARFIREKRRRPVVDPYAWYRPFNEATRALLPLLAVLRAAVRPGDRILDTWCRTGWTGEMLAALFPEQQVVSLWEGDANVLGYKGFRYWLDPGARASNLEVVFCHPAQPLPFPDDYFAVVHGLDSLHRYPVEPFVPECLRVCRDEGVLVFPHNHLTNSEPEPWFERGCNQHHGTHWRDTLTARVAASGRVAYVMPEVPLFANFLAAKPVRIEDGADTDHYNALVLIADRKWENAEVPREDVFPVDPAAFAVVNPMFEVDLGSGAVRLDRDAVDGTVGTMLSRHPIYDRCFGDPDPTPLESAACQALFWARRGLRVSEIAERMGVGVEEAQRALRALQDRDLVQVRAVSPGMARLQSFYSSQREPVPNTFAQLWSELPERFGGRPILRVDDDGSEFGVEEAEALLGSIARLFAARGLVRGDRILIASENHPELVLTLWAAWRAGLVAVPIDPGFPEGVVRDLVAQASPALVFCDREGLAHADATGLPVVVFDVLGGGDAEAPEPEPEERDFISQVEPHLDAGPPVWPELDESDPAVVLFTSGSTGRPKGVVLAQGSLFRTGELMAESYGWDESDLLLSLGGFHVMSGLRNPCWAALHAGCTVLLADARKRYQVLAVAELCRKHQVTVLSTVPAFLTQLEAHRARLRGSPLRSVRQVLTTGAGLNDRVAADVEKHFELRVCNYYGLTETGGVCTGVLPDEPDRMGVIGRALGAIVEIIDDRDRRVVDGQPGEIRVHSDNLMLHYLGQPESTRRALREGWLCTGDLGQRRPDGQIELVGRLDQRIKDRRGEVVYPEEVERLLESCEGVRAASVAGYDAEPGDQRLAAFVVPAEPPADREAFVAGLRETISSRAGRSKVPRLLVVVDELPREASGKVNKRALLRDHVYAR
ncbi:MAG: AMP-binding protein [Proteobacteria bacterium]|nr:AMP-binding protein [Pseudomonadota bacterium]